MADDTREITGWVAWVWFAAITLIMVGFFNSIYGLVAIFNDDYFTRVGGEVRFVDLTAWGWAHLIFGILQILVGIALFSGNAFARWFAIVLAGLNAIEQMAGINTYPVWSLLVIVLDVLVIYALAVHGREARYASEV